MLCCRARASQATTLNRESGPTRALATAIRSLLNPTRRDHTGDTDDYRRWHLARVHVSDRSPRAVRPGTKCRLSLHFAKCRLAVSGGHVARGTWLRAGERGKRANMAPRQGGLSLAVQREATVEPSILHRKAGWPCRTRPLNPACRNASEKWVRPFCVILSGLHVPGLWTRAWPSYIHTLDSLY